MQATLSMISIAAAASVLAGCAASPSRDVPALLVDPTPQSRAELSLAVQRALHSGPIPLSPEALTDSSLLPIDRMARRDSHGRLLNGLEIGRKPEVFRLVRSGNSCVLIHDDVDHFRQTLTVSKCRPAPRPQASPPARQPAGSGAPPP
jgi:hypothetical protein